VWDSRAVRVSRKISTHLTLSRHTFYEIKSGDHILCVSIGLKPKSLCAIVCVFSFFLHLFMCRSFKSDYQSFLWRNDSLVSCVNVSDCHCQVLQDMAGVGCEL
jgi:hypothetical protein